MIYDSAVGPGVRDDIGERQPLDVKVGNRVLFAKDGGTWIYNNTRHSILPVILFHADAPGISGVFDFYWACDDQTCWGLEMRVILADDQAKVRSALRLLMEHQPDVEILGEAADTTGLLDWVRAMCPDLVLLDWELPDLAAVALLPLLESHCPSLQVIAFSVRPELRQAALDAGADAFVYKGDPPERLLMAIDGIDVRRN